MVVRGYTRARKRVFYQVLLSPLGVKAESEEKPQVACYELWISVWVGF